MGQKKDAEELLTVFSFQARATIQKMYSLYLEGKISAEQMGELLRIGDKVLELLENITRSNESESKL